MMSFQTQIIAIQKTHRVNTSLIYLDKEGEVFVPDGNNLGQKYRGSLTAYQRFLANYYRLDKVIELRNTHIQRGTGFNQTEYIL